MANTDLAIQIATTLDATGLNKADKQVKKLDKTVKSLGRTLGLTLGATAMVAYGKAAVKAFAEDEAAAKRLATAVDNLGLSFFKADVETFIGNLEKSASIADDVLRPAFQSLLTTTGSLTKSQELLNNAIQISRASGVGLATVVEDLNKGYVGVTRGLIKYNTGLTRAELQTKSFNEILGIVLAKSAGSAQAYLETTSFKLDALTLAGENAKETIGAGLVDAFAKLGGGSSTQDAVLAIDNIAKGINKITSAAGTAIGAVVKLYKGLDFLTSFGGITGADGKIVQGVASMEAYNAAKGKSARSASPAGTYARTKQQRDAEAAAAKRAKELAALTLKQLKAQKELTAQQKKQAALKKAGTVFDLEQIQLIAALKGKLSAEERLRVEAQLALLNENDVLAQSLTKQILMAQDATGGLYKYFLSIGNAEIKNPFAFLDDWIIEFQKKLNALSIPAFASSSSGALLGLPVGKSGGIGTTSISPTISSNPAIQSTFNKVLQDSLAAGNNYTQSAILGLSSARYEAAAASYGMSSNQVIELKITGDGDLTNSIAKSLQNQSLSSGNIATINRRTGGFE